MTTVRRIAILGLTTIIILLLLEIMFDSNHDKAVPLHQDVILSDPGGPLLVSSVDWLLTSTVWVAFIYLGYWLNGKHCRACLVVFSWLRRKALLSQVSMAELALLPPPVSPHTSCTSPSLPRFDESLPSNTPRTPYLFVRSLVASPHLLYSSSVS